MPKAAPKTTVTAMQSPFHRVTADMLVLGLFEGTRTLPRDFAVLDASVEHGTRRLLRLGDFTGKANQATVLYPTGKTPCRRIMLIGLGSKKSFDINTLRQAAGTAARTADTLGTARIALALHTLVPDKFDTELIGQAIAEGAIVGRYRYQDYLSADDKTRRTTTLRVTIVDPRATSARRLGLGCKVGTALANAQNRTRMVANMPGNEINPPSLARAAQRLAREFGLKCNVFNDNKLRDMKMNAILAVGSGSASKPRLIMLEHRPRGRSTGPAVVVVGKAITFDSGGISIKPSANMETMKFDKSGGCNVLGILTAAAALNLKHHIVGLIPAAENLPSHSSYRPGDIIRTYSGKTVEVQNTDAEGRMILSDALTYAARLKPHAIIDMATLTGACVIALGEHHAGLFGNNDSLQRSLRKAADRSGEPIWAMPSGAEYLEQMRSKIADLKNIGDRSGGACTAAAFLGEFVNDIPWAHIDIAAVADTTKEKPYRGSGATGFGVRLVLEYLRSL